MVTDAFEKFDHAVGGDVYSYQADSGTPADTPITSAAAPIGGYAVKSFVDRRDVDRGGNSSQRGATGPVVSPQAPAG